MTQQYTTYIKAHQDRIEREQQLVAKYNQKPIHNRPRALWAANSVTKHSAHKIDVIEAVIGSIIVAGILIASMFIG